MKNLCLLTFLVFSCFSFAILSIEIDPQYINHLNFGSLKPEQSQHQSLYNYEITSLNFHTDNSAVLQIEASPFVGPDNLPLNNLGWKVVYAQENLNEAGTYGIWVLPLLSKKLNIVDDSLYFGDKTVYFPELGGSQTVMNKHINENNSKGMYQFQFIWFLNVPKNQTAGIYRSTITFTVSE